MSYKVIRTFKDLTDPEKHEYAIDDVYPRDGYNPPEEFISTLVSGSNSAGSIFLAFVNDESEPSENDESAIEEADIKSTTEDKPKRKGKVKKED